MVMLAVSDFGNEMVHCQRGSISVFREFYASINGVLISAGGGRWAIILWGLDTFLIFSNFLRS